MTEVARIGMKVTQAAAAVPAMLACEFGAKVSNCVCQVTHFHDFAMGWRRGQCTLYEQRTPGQQRRAHQGRRRLALASHYFLNLLLRFSYLSK